MSEAVPPNALRPPRRTLWMRVVVALAALVGLTTLILFLGVDHFVSTRFIKVHDARVARLAAQIQQELDHQLAEMAGVASLLTNDVDLVNSTYYHLYLEGGREQPQAAVGRIATAFRLDSVSLWDRQGRPVAQAGSAGTVPLLLPAADETVHTAVVRSGSRVWLVASVAFSHQEDWVAQIQLAQPLDSFLTRIRGFGGEARLADPQGPPPAGAVRIPIAPDVDPPVAVDLLAADEVGLALHDVKTVLALVMTGFGVLLVAGLAVYLRRVLRPVVDLGRAAAAVGRGELGIKVKPRGRDEIAQLVEAFNQMSEGLVRQCELEREVQHREQLSAIGRMAARVAHDLNNPLTVISNAARMLGARRDLDEEMVEDIRLVQHHSERAMATVEALLAYGRPVRLRLREADLDALCHEVTGRWAARFPEVTLKLTPAPSPVRAMADPFRVEQVLDNLLDNARAFARSVEVDVGIADDMAFVRVRDDGPGFPPELRDHLGEPFFTTRPGGTGLGLASCLVIARGHGGDLDIEAGPPATVTLWLPLASPQPAR